MRYTVLNLLLALILIPACKTSSPVADSPPAASGQAQQMGDSFTTLLPITLDPLQFNDPHNQEILNRELSTLSRFSHVGKQAASDFIEAQRQLRSGNRGYARYLIRGASHDCVACHAQTDRGPQFLVNPSSAYFNKLNSLDKAGFLIAVWSFDRGLVEYEKAMGDAGVASQPLSSLENATLRTLSMAVRVRKDPALADAIVTRIMYSKWAPVSLQMNAAKWKAGIQEWKNSKQQARSLDDAKLLISKAWTKQMESPRSGLIESLRASGILQDLLAQKKPGKAYAETLYYAGLNSESLKELDPFQQNQNHFEACVRHVPHTEVAKNCYLRLEGAVSADYTAFESISMPAKVREELVALRKLAEPTGGSWLEWGKGND